MKKEWLESVEPWRMMDCLRLGGVYTNADKPIGFRFDSPSKRKHRLFCCECCSKAHLTTGQVLSVYRAKGIGIDDLDWAENWSASWGDPQTLNYYEQKGLTDKYRADLLRHIMGNPFRPFGSFYL
jgi:GNAT superfamily N-acetyltransferase